MRLGGSWGFLGDPRWSFCPGVTAGVRDWYPGDSGHPDHGVTPGWPPGDPLWFRVTTGYPSLPLDDPRLTYFDILIQTQPNTVILHPRFNFASSWPFLIGVHRAWYPTRCISHNLKKCLSNKFWSFEKKYIVRLCYHNLKKI